MRVLGRELDATAVRAPDDEWDIDLPAREIAQLGGVLDDLVGRLEREVPGHHLDDRAHAGHRHADRGAGEAGLGNRRVDHALGAEAVEKGIGHEVRAAVEADVLAHDDDALVTLHLVGHRGTKRLAIGHYRHGAADPFAGGWLLLASIDAPIKGVVDGSCQ
jgi:hypothetical protein